MVGRGTKVACVWSQELNFVVSHKSKAPEAGATGTPAEFWQKQELSPHRAASQALPSVTTSGSCRGKPPGAIPLYYAAVQG